MKLNKLISLLAALALAACLSSTGPNVPTLTASLFDRPAVVEMACERLAAAGVLDRVTLVGGDFYQDAWPHLR